MRHLCPRDHDRVNELLMRHQCDISKFSNQLQVVKLLKDSKKYVEVLDKIEKLVLRVHGYNFMLKNIPTHGQLSETGENVRIGYQNIRETMEKFGTVYDLCLVKNTAYVKFDNPYPCHSLINTMMMGSNIIHTETV